VITTRKAQADDSPVVYEIAISRWKRTRLKDGLTKPKLEREGFLLYPLNLQQYQERIRGSDHFWVAERAGRIVAYCMAYTFTELESFTSLTENDQNLIAYFRSWGCQAGSIYFAQAATIRSHEARGAMAALAVCLPKHAIERGVSAILCEISLMPRNRPSLAAASRTGFRMVATRTKTDPTNGTDRISGTFIKILENKVWQ